MKIVGLALLSLLLLTAMIGYFFLKSTIPAWEGVQLCDGVTQTVEIGRNPHGVPFIKAGSTGDLFFAIGFVHAQDRLFQMDCQRRAAYGRLSEIFGPGTFDQDVWQKYLRTEAGIEKSFRALKPGTKMVLEQYCRGVNYFLASQNLPPEFHILKYTPEAWQLRDVLAVMKYLEGELTFSGGELSHARLLATLAPERARRWLAAPWPDFEKERLLLSRTFATPILARRLQAETEAAQWDTQGSGWVVAGNRTASGFPLLANDFSWAPLLPALFYQIGGKAPLWEIAGNTLPGIPFIFSGRTWQLGWGINAVQTDTLDYFILDRHADKKNLYRCDGQWLELKTLNKRIRCRGRQDFVMKMFFSKYGPVIEADGCLLAVRSLVQNRSTAVEALYRMNTARNHKEFAAALQLFSAPALRVVFADRKGSIGACQSGLAPWRGKGNGLLPVRVQSVADVWHGASETAGEKFILNPAQGWLTNAGLASMGKPSSEFFVFDSVPDFQGQHLAQALASASRLDLAAATRLQNDQRIANAEFLLARVRDLPLTAPGAKHVRSVLLAWDRSAGEGEGAAFFYEFERLLASAIFTPAFLDPAAASDIVPRWIYPLLSREKFASAVEKSLGNTYEIYRRQTRHQEDGWRWENLHTVTFHHPLGAVFPLRPFFERGPTSSKGGKYCLLYSDFTAAGRFQTSRLAAYKMIIDFSDFDRSQLVYPSGQSGHPMSPAYDDQMDTYATLKYLKMENPGRRIYRLRLIPQAQTPAP